MPEIITRRQDAIGWVLFSNPPRQNAVTYEMIASVPEAMARHERDPKVRVVAFAGGDEHTLGGRADTNEYGSTRDSVATTYIRAMEDACLAVAATRKPVLACMHGVWSGGGLSIALYCDMRVCADDAEFSQPGVRLGNALSYPSTKRLVDLVGPACAAEMLFTGRRVDAAEAQRLGMVNRVVPAASLFATFALLAEEIGENAPLSIAAAKLGIRAALQELGRVDMRDVQSAIDAAHSSDDAVEGRKALAEKRKPRFRGR